jgi:hypothetical protein
MVGLDVITFIATGYRCNVIAGALEIAELTLKYSGTITPP